MFNLACDENGKLSGKCLEEMNDFWSVIANLMCKFNKNQSKLFIQKYSKKKY